ncbi:MAG TPA: hypothetical protein VFS65_01785 [Candidatus Saccharimonadales bacterium]|nr:hypothetical protein [Candidatus Saccharimonadales bacterium]
MNNNESAPDKKPRTLKGDFEHLKERHPKAVKAIAGIAIIGAALTLGKSIEHQYSSPTFSAETMTYTVESGDGLLDAAAEIDGLGDDREGVTYIENMPENQDALSDGLQPGETIIIPISANK